MIHRNKTCVKRQPSRLCFSFLFILFLCTKDDKYCWPQAFHEKGKRTFVFILTPPPLLSDVRFSSFFRYPPPSPSGRTYFLNGPLGVVQQQTTLEVEDETVADAHVHVVGVVVVVDRGAGLLGVHSIGCGHIHRSICGVRMLDVTSHTFCHTSCHGSQDFRKV